jgi:hypothetical protein
LNSLSGHIVNNQFVAPDLFGDYNGDGTVDAADYVAWRKTDGTQYGYNSWRAYFGETIGSGAGNDSTASSGVPEPASLALFLLAASISMTRRPPGYVSPQVATASTAAQRTYVRDSTPTERTSS